MKRISYIILFAVVIGLGTVSSWVYVKYFSGAKDNVLTFTVNQVDITESVRVRGEAVSQKDFNLGFSTAGTVGKIYVTKGALVKEGDALAGLVTSEKQSEVKSYEAVLAGKKAALSKLIAGYSKEDISVSETKVKNAETALQDSRQSLLDAAINSYTVSDNSVRNYADTMIGNSRTNFPSLAFTISDTQLKSSAESERANVENMLQNWEIFVNNLSLQSDFEIAGKEVSQNLDEVRRFLNVMSLAINKAQTNSTVTAASIDTWKTNISTARANITTAISTIAVAYEKWQTADSALTLASQELSAKKASARSEDIAAYEADIAKAESDLSGAKERLARSTIYAPADGKIMKIPVEKGEAVSAGETAVSMSALGSKVEADVSELDIVKINPGQEAEITFDAFPEQIFRGKIISIDPEAVIKDGDTYYRINISFDPGTIGIRSAMSNDIRVEIQTKTSVLSVPKFVIYKKDDKEYAKVARNGKTVETEVKTGVSDGQNIEIVSGLSLDEEVVASND
jgi:RND family efflux transporter MFP subunit